MSKPPLTSTLAVINALGGTGPVSRLTGRLHSAACNWVWARRFPPTTYVIMKNALAEKGLIAPDWLWGMDEIPRPDRLSKADTAEVA